MKIAFQSNQLCERGTEIALYDYAYFNKTILNNESVIVSQKGRSNPNVLEKFQKHFPVYFYDKIEDCDSLIEKTKSDIFYSIRYGYKDYLVKNAKNCIHSVFQCNDPHGEVYAYVSEWLSINVSGGKIPYVPHMINLPSINDNMRNELNIPKNAIVYGRYGGYDTFNIPFVKDAINKIIKERNDIYFVLVNTTPEGLVKDNNIIFLPAIIGLDEKVKYINTCDAMLHARMQGESFGISLGEFSMKNKPIITWNGKNAKEIYNTHQDLAHLDLLGNKGIYYEDYQTIYDILNDFKPDLSVDWNAYRNFLPTPVMIKFNEVFIK